MSASADGEARLPLEEQLSLKLRRFIEANVPELTVKFEWLNSAKDFLRISFGFPIPCRLL